MASVYRIWPVLWEKMIKYGNLFLAAGIFFLAAFLFNFKDKTTFNASVFGFPLIAVAFSLYLTHKQIIHLGHLGAQRCGLDKNSFAVFVGTTLICFAGSLVLYFLVERPFLLLRDRILEKKSTQDLGSSVSI